MIVLEDFRGFEEISRNFSGFYKVRVFEWVEVSFNEDLNSLGVLQGVSTSFQQGFNKFEGWR